jgi:hypothetical protein
MSSEYSVLSLGTKASPIDEAQVMLAPPTPIAHVPRRSFGFNPERSSLNMIVFDVPSMPTISAMRTP